MATDVQSLDVAPRRGLADRLVLRRLVGPVCLLALAPLPFVALQAQMLWERPHYQFFPLVPLGAAALAWGNARRLGSLEPGSRRGVALLVTGSWMVLALSCFLISPWLGSVAALAMLAAVIHAVGGGLLQRHLLPAWAFLGLVVGLPLNFDQELISRLQAMTSRIASLALDLLGVFHVMEGNVVRVSGREFGVEEACSGIYSLFSVLFCTLFFVLWTRRTVVKATLLMISGVAYVLAGNIVRVVSVVYLQTRWDLDVARGWKHELLSLVIFIATLALIAATDCVLHFLPASVRLWRERRPRRRSRVARREESLDDDGEEKSESELWTVPAPALRPALDLGAPTRPPDLRATWIGSWPVAITFGILGLVQMVCLTIVIPGRVDLRFANPWSGSKNGSSLQALKLEDLPARSGNFLRENFKNETRWTGSSVGEMSRFWRYRFHDHSAIVSVDFPFNGWHELPSCYLGQGWSLLERKREPIEEAGEIGGPTVVAAKLAKEPGRQGYLLFRLLDDRGDTLEADDQEQGFFRQRLNLWRSIWHPNGKNGGAKAGSIFSWTYQIQLFIESEEPLSDAEQDEARAFFRELSPAIRRRGPGVEGAGS